MTASHFLIFSRRSLFLFHCTNYFISPLSISASEAWASVCLPYGHRHWCLECWLLIIIWILLPQIRDSKLCSAFFIPNSRLPCPEVGLSMELVHSRTLTDLLLSTDVLKFKTLSIWECFFLNNGGNNFCMYVLNLGELADGECCLSVWLRFTFQNLSNY